MSDLQRFPDELFADIPKWVSGELLVVATHSLKFSNSSRQDLLYGTPLLFLGFTKWRTLKQVTPPVAASRDKFGTTDVAFAVLTPAGISWRYVSIHENDFIKRLNDKAA